MNSELTNIQITEKNTTFIQGVKDCIPTIIGYVSIGIAAGIVGTSSNLSVAEVFLLALFVYAGASQFIICALLATDTPFSVIILTTFIVNLRHFLLCMALAPHFKRYSLLQNIGIGSLITDESFGVAASKLASGEKIYAKWMNGLNVTAYLCWILSCLIGAVFGKWMPNPEAYGFDFALTAMFLALLVLQLEKIQKKKIMLYISLVLYVIITMLLLCLFLPTYIAIIVSTTLVAMIGVVKDR